MPLSGLASHTRPPQEEGPAGPTETGQWPQHQDNGFLGVWGDRKCTTSTLVLPPPPPFPQLPSGNAGSVLKTRPSVTGWQGSRDKASGQHPQASSNLREDCARYAFNLQRQQGYSFF